MRSKALRINYNHHKDKIGQQYLTYLDMFYKAVLVAMIHATTDEVPIVATSVMESPYYRHLLQEFFAAHRRGEDVVKAIDPEVGTAILLDIQIYLNEFMEKHHNFKAANIYSVTIDEKYNVVITNKQITRYAI